MPSQKRIGHGKWLVEKSTGPIKRLRSGNIMDLGGVLDLFSMHRFPNSSSRCILNVGQLEGIFSRVFRLRSGRLGHVYFLKQQMNKFCSPYLYNCSVSGLSEQPGIQDIEGEARAKWGSLRCREVAPLPRIWCYITCVAYSPRFSIPSSHSLVHLICYPLT